MANNDASSSYKASPLVGPGSTDLISSSTGTLPATTNEIEIKSLDVEWALGEIVQLRNQAEQLTIPKGTGSWTGPGADAMSSFLGEVETMRANLVTTLDNAATMLEDAYEAFGQSDDMAANMLGQL